MNVDRLGGEYEPVELPAEPPTELRNISAPIFDGHGRVILR